MGSQAVRKLGFGKGWGFLGIKGMKKSGEDTGVTVEFATVLSYTKTVKKRTEVEKVTGGSKIQAVSAGIRVGNTARIVVNDKDVLNKPGRGFNVIVLAGKNHEVIHEKTYDTHATSKASDQMVADFATVPYGSVIVAAVMDEGARKLTDKAKEIITGMGGKHILKLGYRESYVFMGVKGSKQHVEMRMTQSSKPATAGMILGYSKVVKREKRTKVINQTRTWKKTIRRVYRKVVEVRKGGRVVGRRIVTRTAKRTVTCKRSRKITRTYYKTTRS